MKKIKILLLIAAFCIIGQTIYPCFLKKLFGKKKCETSYIEKKIEPIKIQDSSLGTYKGAILFDLHDVLVNANRSEMLQYVRTNFLSSFKQGWKSLLSWYGILKYYFFAKSEYGKKSFEGCIEEHVAQSIDDKWVVDKFIDIANMQTVNEEMVNIINMARQNGFLVMLTSNIGIKTFKKGMELKNRFGELLRSFQDAYVVASPDKNGNYIAKPHRAFFEKVILKLNEYTLKNPSQIIFVDDSKTNCIAAEESGIQSLIFKDNSTIEAIKNWLFVAAPAA